MNLTNWKLKIVSLIFFVIVFIILIIIRDKIFTYFTLNHLILFTDITNAQNQLNVLIQIAITLFAIMITVIPLAMGLIITYYSANIKKFIWNFSRFKLILGFNFSLIVMLLIASNIITIVNKQILNFIMVLCFLFVITILMIVSFYIFSIVKKIDPSYLIKEISREITLRKVFTREENPIDLFFTLMEDLYNNKDFILLQKSLIVFREKILEISNNIDNNNNLKFFTNLLFNRVKESYSFFFNKHDETFISYTVNTIMEISKDILRKENDEAGRKIVSVFRLITDLAIRNKKEEVIDQLIYHFENLGKISIQKSLNNTLKEILLSLEGIWEHIKSEKELFNLSESVISNISSLAKFAVENQNFGQLYDVNLQLKKIAMSSIKNNYEEDLNEIISVYENILIKTFWGVEIWIL